MPWHESTDQTLGSAWRGWQSLHATSQLRVEPQSALGREFRERGWLRPGSGYGARARGHAEVQGIAGFVESSL
jgi:hypothetical protein